MELGLQRRTDLALRALQVLGTSHDRISGAELARRCETSISFLPQVMGPLIRAGWVESARGPSGGYWLAAELDDITLLKAIEAVQGPVARDMCVLRGGPCPSNEDCPLHESWSEARRFLIDQLESRHVPSLTYGGKP